MKRLQVIYQGQLVGKLHQADTGRLSFGYTATWLSSNEVRPISQSLPLREVPFGFSHKIRSTHCSGSKIRMLTGGPSTAASAASAFLARWASASEIA